VGLKAYRNQVYSAEFDAAELDPANHAPPADPAGWLGRAAVLPRAAWEQQLSERIASGDHWFCGDRTVFPAAAAPAFLQRRQVDAVGVGWAAARALAVQRRLSADAEPLWSDPFRLTPNYVKPSAAEEKAASR
jgi:tRNA A37 threonylcarbamoyladenosine modification protein TsaB